MAVPYRGIPSVLLGIAVLFYMTDRPSKAHWLKPDQREWLEQTLLRERNELEAVHGTMSAWRTLIEPRVLALCIIYIGVGTVSYGIGYFLPQIIKGIGLTVFATGFVAAIPAIVGAVGMVVIGWFSDRSPDRRWELRHRDAGRGGGGCRDGMGWLDLVGADTGFADGILAGGVAALILGAASNVSQPQLRRRWHRTDQLDR